MLLLPGKEYECSACFGGTFMDDWRLICFADHHVLTLFLMLHRQKVFRGCCCFCCLVEDVLHVSAGLVVASWTTGVLHCCA